MGPCVSWCSLQWLVLRPPYTHVHTEWSLLSRKIVRNRLYYDETECHDQDLGTRRQVYWPATCLNVTYAFIIFSICFPVLVTKDLKPPQFLLFPIPKMLFLASHDVSHTPLIPSVCKVTRKNIDSFGGSHIWTMELQQLCGSWVRVHRFWVLCSGFGYSPHVIVHLWSACLWLCLSLCIWFSFNIFYLQLEIRNMNIDKVVNSTLTGNLIYWEALFTTRKSQKL